MKILIAIFSCQMREILGSHKAIRETWLKDVSAYPEVDYRFFMGRGATPGPDTVVVDAPDGYDGLTLKNREVHRWFCQHNYDFMFFADDDTYINMRRLMTSGFEKYDYSGKIFHWPGSPTAYQGYICTGDGCWLSRRACETLAAATDVKDWADDRWMGQILGENGFTMVNLDDYGTIHGSEKAGRHSTYDKNWMYRMYAEKR